jgi:[acyl-carrier-protein] S-malonyltransferase
MFPGERSRDSAMIERALQLSPDANTALMRAASEILGRDLLAHYHSDRPAILGTQRDTQVGVFLANHLHLRSLERAGVDADVSLGLGVGEYNHLVHIGALTFVEALRLVEARGVACDAGPGGAMAAVFPLEHGPLDAVVARALEQGKIEIGEYSSPTEHILSGERPAIEAAVRILRYEHLVEAVVLEPSVAMHSATFWPVVRTFLPALQQVRWQQIARPYLPNASGRTLRSPTPGDLIYALVLHVWRPVRWRESIDLLLRQYPGASFVEVGPRRILTSILQHHWARQPKLHTDPRPGEHPTRAFDTVVGFLRNSTQRAAA